MEVNIEDHEGYEVYEIKGENLTEEDIKNKIKSIMGDDDED